MKLFSNVLLAFVYQMKSACLQVKLLFTCACVFVLESLWFQVTLRVLLFLPAFGPFSGTWVEFFTWYQDGSMFNGDCLDWSLGMWKERHHPNVHLMFYEDMVKNLKPETQKLAEFLGLERTEEQIDKVVQKAQFSSMKNNKATNYEEETFSSGFQFVRSGRIGEWKEYFTPEQNEWMDARIAGKLAGTGLTFQ